MVRWSLGKKRYWQGIAIIPSFIFVYSCALLDPTPVCPGEFYQTAQKHIHEVFAQQEPVEQTLNFNQAMARGLSYNLEQRVYLVNTAVKFGELNLAELTMLPELDATGSIYTRNNIPASFGSGPDNKPNGQIATSSDKTIRSTRLAVKWSLLDLGRGYLKARESSDRILMAEEDSRKQLQKLVQQIRVFYWRAYQAQKLRDEYVHFETELQRAKKQLYNALADKTVPKEEILNFQAILLDGNRRLLQLEDKINTAELQFKYLINLPSDQCIVLEKPPLSLIKIQDLKCLDFEKLDAITLVNRPELRSQNYQKRIAELGTKAAILQALPNVTINAGRNYNSNSFLVNNFWSDASIETSWNIFNLASLPVSLKNVELQTKLETIKLMALTLGALNETRIAFAHYQNLAKEARVAHEQMNTAKKSYQLAYYKQKSSLSGKLQVILTKLLYLYAKLDEIILVADLGTALGDLYIASGFDVLPLTATRCDPCGMLDVINQNLSLQEKMSFKEYVNFTYDNIFCNPIACENVN